MKPPAGPSDDYFAESRLCVSNCFGSPENSLKDFNGIYIIFNYF